MSDRIDHARQPRRLNLAAAQIAHTSGRRAIRREFWSRALIGGLTVLAVAMIVAPHPFAVAVVSISRALTSN
jgi:hypothetical protein